MMWLGAAQAEEGEPLPPEPLLPPQLTAPLEALPEPIKELPETLAVATNESHDYLAGKFVGLARSIDRFFGDERNFQESNDSMAQLDLGRVAGYGGSRDPVLSGRANLHLPNTEKKLHLLVESDPEKNLSSDTKTAAPLLPRETTAPTSYAAALRLERFVADHLRYSADGGMKFQGVDTAPFVRARVSLSLPLEQWRFKAVETLFWFNNIGVGESTQLDFERGLGETALFRATSNATWLDKRQNFDLRQDFSVYQTLGEKAALLYQASVFGVSQPQTEVSNYVLLLRYRYRLHRDWVYFELSPQVHYPKAAAFQAQTLLSMRLEMLFGDSN